jgi:uncharacterized membrane protein YraQ (UPF0718 family)
MLMIWLIVNGILILLIFCLEVSSKLNYFSNLKGGMYKYLEENKKTSIKLVFGTIIGLNWILLNQHGR